MLPTSTPSLQPTTARPTSTKTALIGAWDPAWVANDVAVHPSGDYAYVVGGHDGFSVIDLRDPARPQEVASLSDVDGWEVVTADDITSVRRRSYYVEAGGDQVIVSMANSIHWFDASDPIRPQEIDSKGIGSTWGYWARIALGPGWLYAHEPGLLLLDGSNGFGEERYLGINARGDARANDTHLYVANGSSGIEVFDMRVIEEARAVASFEPTWDAERIALSGDRAYVVGGPFEPKHGLYVLDISNPAHLVQIAAREASLEIGLEGGAAWNAVDVDALGQIVALLSSDGRDYHLEVFDAGELDSPSSGQSPVPLGSVPLVGQGAPGEPRVRLAGDLAVISLGEQGLRVVDISQPSAPRLTGSVETVIGVYDVDVEGDMAYAVTWEHGLRIVDMTEPMSPIERGFYDPPAWVQAVAVSDGIAYVCEADLQILDVSDPERPQPLARWDVPDPDGGSSENTALDVWVDGDTSYLSSSTLPLVVLDVSNPEEPRELGRLEGGGVGGQLFVEDGLAYVASGWEGLRIVDLHDPEHPTELGVYRDPGWTYDATRPGGLWAAQDVWVDGDTAFIAAADDGLHIVDVSDAGRPRLLRHVLPQQIHNRHSPSINGVTGARGQLILAFGYGFLQIVDVAELLAADDDEVSRTWWEQRGIISEGGNRRFVIDEGRMFVAAGLAGLRVFDLSAVIE